MLLKGRAATAKKYRRHHGKSGARSAAGKCNLAIATHKTHEIAARFSVAPPVSVCVCVSPSFSLSRAPLAPSRITVLLSPTRPPLVYLAGLLLAAISTTYINTPAGTMHNNGRVINQGSVSDASATFKRFELAWCVTFASGSRERRGYHPKSPGPFGYAFVRICCRRVEDACVFVTRQGIDETRCYVSARRMTSHGLRIVIYEFRKNRSFLSPASTMLEIGPRSRTE